MRETKFRLIKDNKIVGYEEHRRLDDGMGKFNVFIYHSRTGHPMSWKEITSCPDEYIKHDDKNQFIGLPDKNGKPIYEGDIVKDELTAGKWRKFEIYWFVEEASFWARYIGSNSKWAQNRYRVGQNFSPNIDFEIIGNIYSNPELLENK